MIAGQRDVISLFSKVCVAGENTTIVSLLLSKKVSAMLDVRLESYDLGLLRNLGSISLYLSLVGGSSGSRKSYRGSGRCSGGSWGFGWNGTLIVFLLRGPYPSMGLVLCLPRFHYTQRALVPYS